ncbi:hypothetical protein RHIZO_01433 [Rhizobiaceae bacterium]|nr:hypothetical protein RHIZO_01433 [Rhizobiaceae bacterium]
MRVRRAPARSLPLEGRVAAERPGGVVSAMRDTFTSLTREIEAVKRHDANRDAYLRSLGYTVTRVDAPDVLENAWHVAEEVKSVAGRLYPTRPLRGHPPLEGEGRRPAGSQRHARGGNP